MKAVAVLGAVTKGLWPDKVCDSHDGSSACSLGSRLRLGLGLGLGVGLG